MLAKRIIPCLDVKNDQVVKGIQFNNHRVVGDILELARYYDASGADELVFYDITASCTNNTVDKNWIKSVASVLSIPFCVAGGIRTLSDAASVLKHGADKFSINTPALLRPDFISECVAAFGSQCVVIGIDSLYQDGDHHVMQYTGAPERTESSKRRTIDWVQEIQDRGAGEIVLNTMNNDGVKRGYAIDLIQDIESVLNIPLVASGGAGRKEHFLELFTSTKATGALAASVFHDRSLKIEALKAYLNANHIEVRV